MGSGEWGVGSGEWGEKKKSEAQLASECERGSPADDGKRHLGLVPWRVKGRALAGE